MCVWEGGVCDMRGVCFVKLVLCLDCLFLVSYGMFEP